MQTSPYQGFKLLLQQVVPLSRDAIHIYIGFACLGAALLLWRGRRPDWRLLLPGLAVSLLMELLDLRDDLASLGWFRWHASIKDIINTNLLPALVFLFLRRTSRAPAPAAPAEQTLKVGVFGTILNERGELLLLHRSDHDMWCLPGGLVEVGESLEDAIRRECREELGVEVTVDGLLGVYSDPQIHLFRFRSGAVSHFVTVVFRAHMGNGTPVSCSPESRDLGWFSPDALPRLVPSHRVWIYDAYTRHERAYVR